jgi:hypothetical protein
MEAYLLAETQIQVSRNRPEIGMGYQVGEAEVNGRTIAGYFVSSKVFVPITTAIRSQQSDREYHTKDIAVRPPQPKNFVSGSISVHPNLGRYYAVASATPSEHPENESRTESTDVFFRVSAYQDDKRIGSDGRLAPESYSTTRSDMTVVPSGLAAVGRYALPIRISARYVFQIIPGPGVRIFYGTVIPNYGLCGGGVEVYFPMGRDQELFRI